MKIKFSKFSTIMASLFLVAFLCLMLSYITAFLYYPTLAFFCAGFVMLSIALLKRYLNQKNLYEENQDAIVMELAQGPDGETYVMQSPKQSKKQRNQKRRQNFDRLLPFIVSVVISCAFIYFLIASIVNLF